MNDLEVLTKKIKEYNLKNGIKLNIKMTTSIILTVETILRTDSGDTEAWIASAF